MLPNDPIILISFLNTKLRDCYDNLNILCDDYDVSREEIITKAESAGYEYVAEINQFRASN